MQLFILIFGKLWCHLPICQEFHSNHANNSHVFLQFFEYTPKASSRNENRDLLNF